MRLRLTESDFKNIISSAVRKIIKEEIETNEILSNIVQSLNDELTFEDGSEGMHEKQLSIGDLEIILNYEVHGGKVYVGTIEVWGEEGQLGNVDDNGMVANAITSLTGCDLSDDYKTDPTFRSNRSTMWKI